MKTTSKFYVSASVMLMLTPVLSIAQSVMFIENEKVGILTETPTAPLDINIGTATPGPGNAVLRLERNGPLAFQLKDTDASGFWNFAATGTQFRVSKSGTGVTELVLNSSGDLTVEGDIVSNGTTVVPDYVFEDSYKLMPLSELADFVANEHHLPNVPSASEVLTSGLNMTDMQMRLLEKVEELTLYTLAQEDTITKQQKAIEALTARLEALEGQ